MAQGDGAGRPPIVLDRDDCLIIEGLAAVLSVEQIADHLGIGRTTFYAIRERQPEISEHYKRGKASAINKVANGLLQAALDGDAVRQMFYLKTQAGWKETKVVEGDVKLTRIENIIVDPANPHS